MANNNQIGKAETFVEEYLPINKIFTFDDNFSANDEVLKSTIHLVDDIDPLSWVLNIDAINAIPTRRGRSRAVPREEAQEIISRPYVEIIDETIPANSLTDNLGLVENCLSPLKRNQLKMTVEDLAEIPILLYTAIIGISK